MLWVYLNTLVLIFTVTVLGPTQASTIGLLAVTNGTTSPPGAISIASNRSVEEQTSERTSTTERTSPPSAAGSSSTVAPGSTPVGNRTASNTPTPEPDDLNSLDSSIMVMNQTVEKQLRIEAIKQDILNRLGMTRVPDVSRVNMTVPQRRQILRLYRKSVEELHDKRESSFIFDDDQFYANQFYSFTEAGDKPSSIPNTLWGTNTQRDKKRIYFSVDIPEPADPRKETVVKSATLKLYKREVRPQNLARTDVVDRSLRIEIYQILPPVADKLVRRSLDSRLVSLDKTAWEEFDISRAIQDWIRDPTSNLGLEISCDSRYNMEDVVTFVIWSQAVADNPYQSSLLPVLNVLTQEKRILGRQKRSAPERHDCVVGDGEERCCRYPLTIRFRDINWHNWVIEPQSYQAYYCAGTCPRDYRVAHRYARIKSLMRDRNPSMPLSLECMETKMGNLNIAHYNSDGVLVVSVFENMYPLECMCA